MYVAVKGGETAIAHSLELLADRRRGDRDVPELSLQQIDQQLALVFGAVEVAAGETVGVLGVAAGAGQIKRLLAVEVVNAVGKLHERAMGRPIDVRIV